MLTRPEGFLALDEPLRVECGWCGDLMRDGRLDHAGRASTGMCDRYAVQIYADQTTRVIR